MRHPDFQEFMLEELLGSLNDVEKKNTPAKLYLAGDRMLLASGARVSVVGSRNASADGLRRTEAFTNALVERGIVVVSGLAEGVDTVAHETALSSGGHTVAVLGTGLARAFPPGNQALQERITREQLAVSQFPPDTPPRRQNFPMRNRTMALISDATVIVEAGEDSGTLHQGWEALRLGRLLLLMESVTKRDDLNWPAEMLRYGAQVLSRDNLEKVLDAVPEKEHREIDVGRGV